MDCCELALANSKLAFYIALGGFGTIALLLLMFFGYNLTLGARTTKLEKKNGHEQEQINQLIAKINSLENEVSNLPAKKNPL
jgi:uncharacterized protein YlxW (UPF0749 family)